METASPPNPFLKQNGSDLYCGGTQNGSLRCFQDEEEEDFGPETDVDAVDDVLMQPSSIAAAKALVSSQNKDLEDDLERQRQQLSEFDDPADADRSTNTPTPPARDVGLPEEENVAESGGEGDDSDEEEWNYIKGEQKPTHTPTKEELEEMESQLNPDAPVFIPETAVLGNPKLNIDNDLDISSSPVAGSEKSLDDVPLPTQNDFHRGIIECAGEFNRHNGMDVRNTESFDGKHKTSNTLGDDSEILSTKAEYGDDSAFSFSNSMNTSTAFSSGIPHDDKGSSDMLFSNENDFDPSMDAPKELQDLVSSPEPDETMIPSTPRSTVAEASASPAILDTSPSQFLDFEKINETPTSKDQTVKPQESSKSDSFFNEKNVFSQEHDNDNEPQKPLTFAEVLKRPSPRTSPEPPVEPSAVKEEIIVEEENQVNDTNPFAEELKAELVVEEPVFDVEVVKDSASSDLKDIEITEFDTTEESNESAEVIKIETEEVVDEEGEEKEIKFSDDIKEDIKLEPQNVTVEDELSQFENSVPSPFVTVRKTPVDDDDLVEFDKLKSEEEKPPQFFQVDDSVQHFDRDQPFDHVEQKIHELPQFDGFEHNVKATLPQEELMASLMQEKASENLQFMSINSEGSVTESASDFDAVSKNEQVDDVPPGDLQFGTINTKLEFGDDFNFSAGQTESVTESKESNAVRSCQELEENYFEQKSTTEIKEPTLDFNESHFKDEKLDILAGDGPTQQSFETNFESKFDAQDITLGTHASGSEFLSNEDKSVPPVSSPVNESANDNSFADHVDDLQKRFDDHVSDSKEEFLFSRHDDVLSNMLKTDTGSDMKLDSQETSNPFLDDGNRFNEGNASENLMHSQFESASNFASEQLSGKEFAEIVTNESVFDQKSFETLSTPVKQQEETLEQTINVDFIPAEPLATPDSHHVSPTIPKEEPIKSEDAVKVEEEPLNPEETVRVDESVTSETLSEVVPPSQVSETVEELSKDADLATGTPPPTPAPGIAEPKPEEKEGLLAAAAAAAVAGAAATAGVVAAKASAKKSTTSPATVKKTSPTAGPKKPTDLKTGVKTSSPVTKTTASPKLASSPAKPTAPPAARKSLTSTTTASKPAAKPGTKPSTTAKSSPITKTSTVTSKPSTPPSKPTTPTSSSRPSSATKTSPTKPSITARSTVPAASKPKTTSTVDKKPLTNGDISKPGLKKPDLTSAVKKSTTTTTTAKTLTATSKPLASRTTTTSVTSKAAVSSAPKTSPIASSTTTNKPKTTAAKPASTLNAAAKAKLPAKPTDKTVKETVNKQISSATARVGANKVAPSKTTTTLKKTETKTSPAGKTAANKTSTVVKKMTTVAKKEDKSEVLTQDHIITTTNGFTEELIENGVKLEKDSSPLDNNICDDTIAATN